MPRTVMRSSGDQTSPRSRAFQRLRAGAHSARSGRLNIRGGPRRRFPERALRATMTSPHLKAVIFDVRPNRPRTSAHVRGDSGPLRASPSPRCRLVESSAGARSSPSPRSSASTGCPRTTSTAPCEISRPARGGWAGFARRNVANTHLAQHAARRARGVAAVRARRDPPLYVLRAVRGRSV